MTPRRLRVLLSAYACEPGKGSEPEVGWRTALGMAQRHQVTVLTRTNNRGAIEQGLAGLDQASHPDFLYYDLPPWLVRLKRHGLPLALYYYLWQVGAAAFVRPRLAEFDLVHHVTFNSLVLPGCWWSFRPPVVLGPLGGGQTVPWAFLPSLRGGAWAELFRGFVLAVNRWAPPTRRSFRRAARLLVVNEETEVRIPRAFRCKLRRMLETAIDPRLVAGSSPSEPAGGLKFLWVGRWIGWKGPELALRAFAFAAPGIPGAKLVFAGSGPLGSRLRDLAGRLGIADRVILHGRVAPEAMGVFMSDHHVFLFTSLHDTSGNVLLEAMARGLPCVVLHHHGAAVISTPQTARQIRVTSPSRTVADLAEAMQQLADSPDERRRLGEAGRRRIQQAFLWPRHFAALDQIYQETAAEAAS